MWDLICAMQQYDPQEHAEAFGKALFSECHTSKRLCLIIVRTGQRKCITSRFIFLQTTKKFTLSTRAWYSFVNHIFYVLNGKYSTCMFLGISVCVLKERALPANSFISACRSRCIFWLTEKSLWFGSEVFCVSSSGAIEICNCESILHPCVLFHHCQ